MLEFIKFTGFVFCVILSSCTIGLEDLKGVYEAKNMNNTIDTLRVLSDGTYERVLYRKIDTALLFRHTGNWWYSDGRIVLSDYLLNDDRIFLDSASGFENVLITSSFLVDRKSGNIVIGYMEDTDRYLYEKEHN